MRRYPSQCTPCVLARTPPWEVAQVAFFNRDMFLNIPLIADWHAVTKRREHLVNENLMRENKKRRRHDYAIDQRVLKKRYKPTKLGPRTSGPYRVTQTHVNGTITIDFRQGVTERINIRRVIPYKE